jgi:hypothetical protein
MTGKRLRSAGSRSPPSTTPLPLAGTFHKEGHRLYDSEKDLSALLTGAGFHDVQNHVITRNENTLGWLTTGQAR